MENKEPILRVLIFPWLAHGHISPYLELSKELCKRNFQVYFCSTAINLSYVKKCLKENSSDFAIELVELHLDSSPELPPQYHTTKGLPPNLMPTLFHSFTMAKPSFSKIIHSLNPDLLIYDCFQSWSAVIASSHGIPSVYFSTSGAASIAFFHHHLITYGFEVKFPFPEIYLDESVLRKLRAFGKSDFGGSPFKCFELSSDIVLMKASKAIEEKYLNYLQVLTGKRMVPLGPLVHDTDHDEENGHIHIIKWLDKKEVSSVVFVSFGSENFLSEKEREEIAFGLELSNVEFIWVVMFPIGQNMSIEEALPEGFLERIKNKGIIVDGWVPQVKILQHASVGGFLSHCGWSSIMESLCYGTPLIAMPIKDDQPTNARLVVEIGAAREVLRDENGNLKREEIAKAINDVVAGKDSEALRSKTIEWSEKLRLTGEKETDEGIRKLKHVCIKKMQH